MRPFRYLGDAAFQCGCFAYAINRWLIKPHFHTGFFHSHFNDLWLIPCALPPVLWLHRRLGLRPHDGPPSVPEILSHLVFWSVLFEYVGPKYMPWTTADPLDVLAYMAGALGAGLWWHRERWAPVRL
jgi:hypothetical protein